jgi:hypothetical protein
MRTAIILVVLFTAAQSLAQDNSRVTVKSSVVNNGVVIVAVQSGKTSFELQCNKNVMSCKVLEPGDYMMVRLPKNHGMYDCTNVNVYPKSADPNATERIGEYCIIEQSR